MPRSPYDRAEEENARSRMKVVNWGETMKPNGISISELDKETLKKLGLDGIHPQVIALSRVLDSIRGAQKDDAIWALRKALEMCADPPAESPNYSNLVIQKVSQLFGFLPEDIITKGRSPDLVIARQVVMYVLWRSDKYTLGQIGKALGGRTPATVSWGAQTIYKTVHSDPKIASLVQELLAV